MQISKIVISSVTLELKHINAEINTFEIIEKAGNSTGRICSKFNARKIALSVLWPTSLVTTYPDGIIIDNVR